MEMLDRLQGQRWGRDSERREQRCRETDSGRGQTQRWQTAVGGGQRPGERQDGHTVGVVWTEPLFPASALCPYSDYDERGRLHDAFAQMTHSLQEVAAAQGSFNVAFLDAAEKMRKVIMKLKQVRACVPPCGFQDVARRFVCFGCYSQACNLPLDCPVQDVTVTRGRQAKFSCAVNFQLPKEEITYSWKFAGGGVRTQDQSYFRDIPRAHGYLARIRPVQPTHSGTFSCSVLHDQRPVARLYFFLDVTSAPPRGEIELQVSFRKVLRWEPRETELEPWRPSLGELLARPGALTPGNRCLLAALAALAAASATLMVWLFFRWYLKSN
ncbi:sperm acrosome membrane-associated protein 6 isoform X1 [Suricata suricatta]|uniref:sperm acrosome membrane-associated protein 6 isoform X1 n=1 Tax=Suricata suricatta TaxID=37032 RepID=UPI001155C1BB|nr:sperm acrosome membrane-associated protein 6 isoform X1 [Suricata suricatta]